MRMTTFKLKQLLAALLCILCIPASAQLSRTIEQYANSNYAPVAAEFTLTEVANALATDTTTLNAALDAWYDDEVGEVTNMFFLADPNDETVLSDNYTQGSPGGFWVGFDGLPMAWGEGCAWFDYLYWDAEEDAFEIVFGQFPDAVAEGATFTPHFVLKCGDKQVTIDITYIVKPVPSMPEPTTVKLSELNVVGSTSVNAHRTDIQGYDATTLSVDATEIINALGLEQSLVGAQLSQMLYTEWYDTEFGLKKDSLTNESTAGAPGWWLRKTLYSEGELRGEPSPDVAATVWGADCHIFLQGFAYDEESNVITCDLGQYPGTPVAGDSVSANIYVIYADKAYRINYQVVFDEAEGKDLADMTNAGNTDFDLTFYDSFADYQTITIDVNMASITEILGCEASALTFTGLKDEEGLWVGDYTGNNGYWFTPDGYVCNWGSGAGSFAETVDDTYTQFNVGLYAGLQANIGETYVGKIYFVNGSSYYTLTINCTVAHKEGSDQSTWQIVEKRPAVVQVIADAENFLLEGNQTTYTLTLDQISSVLGIEDPVMYCAMHDSITANTGELYAPYSKYLCTPAPGVWLNQEGSGSGYNGTQTVGICWDSSTGVFTVYQLPGANAVGSTYTAPIYMVDEENGRLIEINFTIEFVDELKSAEIVGTENISVPVTIEANVDIDLTKPATALGVTVEELLASYSMKGMKSNGLYSEGQDPINMGLSFLTDGFYDDYGSIYLMIVKNGDAYQLNIAGEEMAEDYRASGAFCFEIDEKIYIYNVTFLSESLYANGIEDIKADIEAGDGKIYDLSGRQVINPTKKGIYIINGKKHIIK